MLSASVPSSVFFLYRRSVFYTLVLVFGAVVPFLYPRSGFGGPGNIRQNHPFGNHPFANRRRLALDISKPLVLRGQKLELPYIRVTEKGGG